jgi:hypothetical protein
MEGKRTPGILPNQYHLFLINQPIKMLVNSRKKAEGIPLGLVV